MPDTPIIDYIDLEGLEEPQLSAAIAINARIDAYRASLADTEAELVTLMVKRRPGCLLQIARAFRALPTEMLDNMKAAGTHDLTLKALREGPRLSAMLTTLATEETQLAQDIAAFGAS